VRIALLADIHGNAFALERVLAGVAEAQVDVVACLGDIAVLGPDPAGAIDLIRAHADIVVRGNTDEWLVDDTHPELGDAFSRDITTWTRERIGDDRLAWIATLPLVATVAGVTLVHATARSASEVVTDLSADEAFAAAFGSRSIVAGGHIHLQVDHRAGTLRYVNAGSIGLPGAGPDVLAARRRVDPDAAEWAIVDVEGSEVAVSFRRTPLPMREMATWEAGCAFPLLAWWQGRWAKATGR
jgi:predicted phosphodiesterase